MNFEQLRIVNRERLYRWHTRDSEDWSLADWSNAAAGEMGEVCNAVKKLRRHDTGVKSSNQSANRQELIQNVATEIGDTVVYLDLLCSVLGIRLEDCVRDTFNRVSTREGFPEKL